MQAFGLTSLALEWPEDLAPAIRAFLAGQTLPGHWFVRGGDGRITAGHLAVLAERAAGGGGFYNGGPPPDGWTTTAPGTGD
jgi:hypothetical protein